jgi:transposase
LESKRRSLQKTQAAQTAQRVTNPVAEGLNSKIQTIKKMAHGFRNPEHFKIAIFFDCGGLQLYPATHANPG